MKPDWKDAPVNTHWLAQDSDGSWEWHGTKPFPNKTGSTSFKSGFIGYWDHKKPPKIWQTGGKGDPNPRWTDTLERRP